MSSQTLSVRLPDSIHFPDGVDVEDLVRHLIAWYFYSCGNNEFALKLTGESPLELENKLLKLGFSSQWISRMDSESIRNRVEAMDIVKEADDLAEQRVKAGWKEDDFKKDFLRVQREIAGILMQREHGKGE